MLKPYHVLIVEANDRVSEFRLEVEHQYWVREAKKSALSQSHNLSYRLVTLIRRYQQAKITRPKHHANSILNDLQSVKNTK